MNFYPDDVGTEIEAYAAYLYAPRGFLDGDEQVLRVIGHRVSELASRQRTAG